MAENSDKSTDPTFKKVVDYFLRTPPQPKKSEKPTAKREKRKSSDRVAPRTAKAKQSK